MEPALSVRRGCVRLLNLLRKQALLHVTADGMRPNMTGRALRHALTQFSLEILTMDHDTIMQYIHEIFDPAMPRLGPGDDVSTDRALDAALAALSRNGGGPRVSTLDILDVGCGNGAQTIRLAHRVNGTITALDNHRPYLDELRRRAGDAGVSEKIETVMGDMHAPDFGDGSFDLVWAEGSFFVMGFLEGVALYREKLRPGGVLAASELCWLRPHPPVACREFFTLEYPAMGDLAGNCSAIERRGFDILEYFALPDDAWTVPYYEPLEHRLDEIGDRHAGDPGWTGMISMLRDEIETRRRYAEWYGNVFFIMRRK